MADEIIDETHPLHKTEIGKVFPLLKPFANCFKKKEAEGF